MRRATPNFGGSPSPLDRLFANVAKHYGLPGTEITDACAMCGGVHSPRVTCPLTHLDSEPSGPAKAAPVAIPVRYVEPGVTGRDLHRMRNGILKPNGIHIGQVWVDRVGVCFVVARVNDIHATLEGSGRQSKIRLSSLLEGSRWKLVREAGR